MAFNEDTSFIEYNVGQPTQDFVTNFSTIGGTTDVVLVTVDGVLTDTPESSYTVQQINHTTWRVTPEVQTGSVVRLYRVTDLDQMMHVFTAGSKFIARNMDNNFKQIRHSQQEVRDAFDYLEYNTLGVVEAAKDATELANTAAQAAYDAAAQVTDELELDASFVVDASGKTQQEINNFTVPRIGVDSIILKGSNNASIDTALLSSAISTATITGQKIEGLGLFKIDSNLNLRNLHVDFTNSSIEVTNPAAFLTIGGNAASTINKRQSFGRVFRTGGASLTIPTIRVAGTKDQFFDVQACDYMQLYADTAVNPSVDGSIAYCTFNLGKIDKLEITNNPANTAAGGGVGGHMQWINENRFEIQRCANFEMSGTYAHNHNKVFGGTFESGSKITVKQGLDNQWHGVRFENGATVTFDAGTERNVVVNTYDSSFSNVTGTATVIDNGFDNAVIDDFSLYTNGTCVAYTDVSETVLNTQVGQGRLTSLQKIQGLATSTVLLTSDFVPVLTGDWFRWVSVGQSGSIADANARYRASIEFYDRKLQPVASSASFILSTGGTFSLVESNYIVAGTNVSGAMLVILPAAIAAGVAFVKVLWYSNSPLTASISNAVQMSITKHSSKSEPFRSLLSGKDLANISVSTAVPTQGFAPLGLTCVKQDGTEQYINAFSFETTLASYTGADIVVATATGVLVGDVVGVNLDDGSTHWTTVSAMSGTTLTLAAGLPSACAAGSRVVFNRWYTKA